PGPLQAGSTRRGASCGCSCRGVGGLAGVLSARWRGDGKGGYGRPLHLSAPRPDSARRRPATQLPGRAAVTGLTDPAARTMPVADEHESSHLLDDEEQSPFALREPGEIAAVLRALVEARALISASLVPGGHACPTALLAVHDDGTLVFDGNRDEAMNQRMAAASRMVCSAQLDLVPIRFRVSEPARIVHEDYVAFATPWPQALLRMQRREMYRLQSPASAPVTVHLGDADRAPDPAAPGLRVLDISGSGLAIAIP